MSTNKELEEIDASLKEKLRLCKWRFDQLPKDRQTLLTEVAGDLFQYMKNDCGLKAHEVYLLLTTMCQTMEAMALEKSRKVGLL